MSRCNDVEQQQRLIDGDDSEECDGRTPLDKTIDRIGMGSYQWALLSLCGFGWMADNMWLQAAAMILPRVQRHYSVPDSYIGSFSSSMFAGMMIGAVGWGTCSDIMGRSTAFNATLFFTAVFGFLASLSNSFGTLCVTLFFLGSSVGGSMPTDGTLLLEQLPREKQYLVTALSVFFSVGSVVSAVAALLVLPNNSCPLSAELPFPSTLAPPPCDVETQNLGWKYVLITHALITLSMFLGRIVFFRLHESPRYLVHAGRPHDAIKSLQMISKFNGSNLSIELEDVRDHFHNPCDSGEPQGPVDDIQTSEDRRSGGVATINADETRTTLVTGYDSTGETPVLDPDHALFPPLVLENPHWQGTKEFPLQPPNFDDPSSSSSLERPRMVNPPPISRTHPTRRLSDPSMSSKTLHILPPLLRRPLRSWWNRVLLVLSPEWRRTTVLMWSTWCAMALAYTMFNVYLPKLLETGYVSGSTEGLSSVPPTKTLEQSLWDVVIFTIGGCPGAILGAWLIETRLGRRWSLAGSTFITAFFCVVFVLVESTWAVRSSTVGISLSVTTMWSVLYGWTPDVFGTKVRGTACGIASALSRIGGMIAPMLGGVLLMMDRSLPVYASAVVFVFAGFCVLKLKEDEGEGGRGSKGDRVAMH
ncbi:hypothetical protein K443DRAFT_241093 [Laccaria amethystina LaAM-08-1]|uniref:Major facilitator superfamily (MFS) profile domain-containing protein n=1 Tax=Laccaria amethystina LaAM-08-1 TaxID=1095629 RepID=A0A0C9WXS7_9AGAR|nr:hypothetical protein K443DRAFT_241093 [Laccaria amethystina LaAM-08-1]